MNLYNGIKGGKVLNKELASKIKDQNAKIAIVARTNSGQDNK